MSSAIQKTLKKFYPAAYKQLSQAQKPPLSQTQELPLSQETVFLSQKNYQSIQKIVKSLYELKDNPLYQKTISKHLPELAKKQSRQNSPLMAYDFHTQQNSVKLIEVNTNGSAFLLTHLLYQSSAEEAAEDFSESAASPLQDLKKSFAGEWRLFNPNKKKPKIVLIDEAVQQQKMRFEFFMYQDFFSSMGWKLEILESKNLLIDKEALLYTPKKEKIDFIYNRTTDFYFEKHPHLAKAYQNGSCLILPQPRDYALLADKKRLLDWQSFPQLKSIQKYLLKAKAFNKKTSEELWKNRRKYFFKVQQAYGGKLAYRGSSLTHKKKEELLRHNSLAQEYCPPDTLTDSKGQKWKVDLRAYAYKAQVQLLVARIYQGQITNFKVADSGFAKVKIIP